MLPNPSDSDNGYEEVDVLRNSDGLIVIVTRRKLNGALTAGLYREFERKGKTERTSFIPRRLLDSATELLKIAGERMDQLGDAQRAPQRATK